MLVDVILEAEKFLYQRGEIWINRFQQQEVAYKLCGEFVIKRENGIPRTLSYYGNVNYTQAQGAGGIKFSPTGNGGNIREQFVIKLENIMKNTFYKYEYNKDDDTLSIELSADIEKINQEVKALNESLGLPTTEHWKR